MEDDEEQVVITTAEDRLREKDKQRNERWTNLARSALLVLLGPCVRRWEEAKLRVQEHKTEAHDRAEANPEVRTGPSKKNDRRVQDNVQAGYQHEVRGASTDFSLFDLNEKVTLGITDATNATLYYDTTLRPCDLEYIRANPKVFVKQTDTFFQASCDEFTDNDKRLLQSPLNALTVLERIVGRHNVKKGSGMPQAANDGDKTGNGNAAGDETGNGTAVPDRQSAVRPWFPMQLLGAQDTIRSASGTVSTSFQSTLASLQATRPNQAGGASIPAGSAANDLSKQTNADTSNETASLSGQEGVAGSSAEACMPEGGDWECDRIKTFKEACKYDKNKSWSKTTDSEGHIEQWKKQLKEYNNKVVPKNNVTAVGNVWNRNALLIIARLCEMDQGGQWQNTCSFCKLQLQRHRTEQLKRLQSSPAHGHSDKKGKPASKNAPADHMTNANTPPKAGERNFAGLNLTGAQLGRLGAGGPAT